ncbi:unnamed protein product [Orchesella dallaii]|uniref:C2 domain-containing protein n=1 Tax=Orchesella dallaii TaxID=48710 RepID=A0ABP1R6P4_9HEXA
MEILELSTLNQNHSDQMVLVPFSEQASTQFSNLEEDSMESELGSNSLDDVYMKTLQILMNPCTGKLCNSDTGRNSTQIQNNSRILHLQKIFNIEVSKHSKLLGKAEANESRLPLVLNLEVVEAKGLKSKDSNGLSNPFCTVFLSPEFKLVTSTKLRTFKPVWQEVFSIPVSSIQDDIISIEIINSENPEEPVKKKKKGIGLKYFVKDIKSAASTGKWKNNDSPIGCLQLPLKEIPTEGTDSWYPLESKKGTGKSNRGEIHLKMGISTKHEKEVVEQVYQNVLRLMLRHQSKSFQYDIDPLKRDGLFGNKNLEELLKTLEFKGGLTTKDSDLAKWLVFTKFHCDGKTLDAKIFFKLLHSMVDHVNNELLDENELRNFWQSTEKLLENFVTILRNIHQYNQPDLIPDNVVPNDNMMSQTYYMLQTMEFLRTYLATTKLSIEKEIRDKLTPDLIMEKAKNAVTNRANEFFNGIAPLNLNSEKSRIRHMAKVAKLLITDLAKSLEVINRTNFTTTLTGDYFRITYLVYDKRYFELVKPIVEQTCCNMKPLDLINDEDDYECCQDDYVSVGLALFKLYLELKQFADLSLKVQGSSTMTSGLCIRRSFHTWFQNRVIMQWLTIGRFRAMRCIRSAVQHDFLQPIQPSSKITSSAIDTAGILQSIETWNSVSWLNLEDSSSLLTKMIEDIGRCAIYYGDLMSKRIDEIGKISNDNEEIYEVYYICDQVAYVINNVQRVGQEIKPICEKIGINNIKEFVKDSDKNQSLPEKPYPISLTTAALEGISKQINNKIISILEKIGLKMLPSMQKLIAAATESESGADDVENVLNYFNFNLIIMKRKLISSEFFEIMRNALWRNVLLTLRYRVAKNIEKKSSPEFFQKVKKMLVKLEPVFYPPDSDANSTSISVHIQDEIEKLLEIHGSSTPELILKYLEERRSVQMRSDTDLGLLTVRAQYCADIETLKIEVLNARHLKPRYPKKAIRDSYVKFNIVTKEGLKSTPALHKTKTQWKTLFPLFDEIFSIPLKIEKTEELLTENGMITFTLKDYGMLGTSAFIGDAILPFNLVSVTSSETKFEHLPQLMLTLTLPNEEFNSMTFQALEKRIWDRSAVEFAKKERIKIS